MCTFQIKFSNVVGSNFAVKADIAGNLKHNTIHSENTYR